MRYDDKNKGNKMNKHQIILLNIFKKISIKKHKYAQKQKTNE